MFLSFVREILVFQKNIANEAGISCKRKVLKLLLNSGYFHKTECPKAFWGKKKLISSYSALRYGIIIGYNLVNFDCSFWKGNWIMLCLFSLKRCLLRHKYICLDEKFWSLNRKCYVGYANWFVFNLCVLVWSCGFSPWKNYSFTASSDHCWADYGLYKYEIFLRLSKFGDRKFVSNKYILECWLESFQSFCCLMPSSLITGTVYFKPLTNLFKWYSLRQTMW